LWAAQGRGQPGSTGKSVRIRRALALPELGACERPSGDGGDHGHDVPDSAFGTTGTKMWFPSSDFRNALGAGPVGFRGPLGFSD